LQRGIIVVGVADNRSEALWGAFASAGLRVRNKSEKIGIYFAFSLI